MSSVTNTLTTFLPTNVFTYVFVKIPLSDRLIDLGTNGTPAKCSFGGITLVVFIR